MKRQLVHLVLLTVMGSPLVAQERPRVSAPAPERTRERTMVISPDVDALYYFSVNRGKMGLIISTEPEPSDSIGALVDGVSPGSPAFKAGMRPGDLITRFNGRSVLALARENRKVSPGLALVEVAAALNNGDTARLEYRRGTSQRSTVLVLEPLSDFGPMIERRPLGGQMVPDVWEGPMPAGGEMLPSREPAFVFQFRTMADLELAPMNPGLGQYFGVASGVLVINAPEGTTLNLKSGDVVTLVDGRQVSSPNQFFRVLRSYQPGEQFRFQIMRMKRREVVTGTLAER